MKNLAVVLAAILSFTTILGFSSCSDDDPIEQTGLNPGLNPAPNPTPSPNPSPNPNLPVTGNKGVLKVGSASFIITFQDSETANTFKQMLPLAISMTEMGGYEKYGSLPQGLPGATFNPGTIQNGDLMHWSSNTLVLFYKMHTTSYSYKRIGRVDNPAELESALGRGNVTITIEMQE